MKKPIGKWQNKILLLLFRIYWFLFRPVSAGVKVVLTYRGEVLVVRHTYGMKRYTFPGGGVEKMETPEKAAIREIKEELGVNLEEVIFCGSFISTEEYKKDTVYVYTAELDGKNIIIDGIEIQEASWFFKKELPHLGPVATRVYELYEQKN